MKGQGSLHVKGFFVMGYIGIFDECGANGHVGPEIFY